MRNCVTYRLIYDGQRYAGFYFILTDIGKVVDFSTVPTHTQQGSHIKRYAIRRISDSELMVGSLLKKGGIPLWISEIGGR